MWDEEVVEGLIPFVALFARFGCKRIGVYGVPLSANEQTSLDYAKCGR